MVDESSLSLVSSPGSLKLEDQKGPGTEELPMVFLCAGCKRPVGDTLSWETNDEDANCILLKSERRGARKNPCPDALAALRPVVF